MTAHDELLYWAMANNHALYKKYLEEEYVKEHGHHFNEEYAKEAVESMHSTDMSGIRRDGEHWTIEQIKAAIVPYSSKFHTDDTCWDAYVAIHAWWHDLSCNYRKHGRSDNELIEDAITWAFTDEDASDGKIWKYIKAVN